MCTESDIAMIETVSFWKEESESPLLNRNAGFLNLESAHEIVHRVTRFPDIVWNHIGKEVHVELQHDCDDEATLRIFRLDAERTFNSSVHRTQMTEVLYTMWHEIGDYHQGLGFVVAFLLLFLPEQDVVNICSALHRHYVPGYYKAASEAYVRDAKVYWKLLVKFFPHVAQNIDGVVPPEAFCSKWFIGLCVHVLPFKALILFFEAFLEGGVEFLFKFGLSLIKSCEADLMATNQPSIILAILRLDSEEYKDDYAIGVDPEKGSFYCEMVENAINFNLEDTNIEKLRKEALSEMQAEAIRRKEREDEMGTYSDDEIVFSDEDDGHTDDDDDDEKVISDEKDGDTDKM